MSRAGLACASRLPPPASRFPLFDISAEIEPGPGKRDNAIESFSHVRRQVTPSLHGFRLSADRLQRFHEVSFFQFAGVVSHRGLPETINSRSSRGCPAK